MADEIDVKILATTADFQRGMKDAKEALRSMGDGLKVSGEAFKAASAESTKFNSAMNSVKESIQDIGKVATKQKDALAPLQQGLKGFKLENYQLVNLSNQIQDIGVSLAGGQDPLRVFIQQGSQIASVFGASGLIVTGVAAGITALGYAFYSAAASAEKAAQTVQTFGNVLATTNKQGISGGFLQQYSKDLALLPGINQEAAESIITEFSRASGIGASMIVKLSAAVSDFAAATATEPAEAAKLMADAFSNPANAAQKLQQIFNNSLNPAILQNIAEMEKHGKHIEAQAALFDLLGDKISGKATSSLRGWRKELQETEIFFQQLGYAIDSFNSKDSLSSKLGLGKIMDRPSIAPPPVPIDKGAEAAAEKQRQANVATQKSIDLAKQFPGVMETRAQLTQRLIELEKGLAGVTDREGRSAIQSAMQRTRQEMANLNDLDIQKKAQNIQAQRQLDSQNFEVQEQLIRANSDLKRSAMQGDFAAQQQVTAQEMTALRMAKQQEWEIIRQSFDRQMALYNRDSLNFNRIHNQKLTAERKFQLDMTRLNKERIDKEIQDLNRERGAWQSRISGVSSAFTGSIKGMITGQETLGQAGLAVMDSLLSATIDYFTQKAELWLFDAILGKATEAAMGASIIGGHAAEAGAAAYASTAAIPFIGPELAPAAAATAYAGAMSFSALLPLAVGAYEIPKDMPAMLHQGEAVVPKTFAEGLRQNGGFGNGGGGNVSVAVHISAMDGHSVARMLKNNSGAISDAVAKGLRQNHKSLNNQMKAR